ncbi:MAG: cupin domain-containing protein [Pseudomonadota bacterium]
MPIPAAPVRAASIRAAAVAARPVPAAFAPIAIASAAFAAVLALGVGSARAHDDGSHGADLAASGGSASFAQTVVPSAEKDRAQELLADGPTETTGVSRVSLIGSMPLDGEFQSSDGLVMRVRELVIEPGGIVAVHQHTNRPGAAYIVEGELVEHRSTEAGPVVKTAGETAMERSGVIHWWENESDAPARAVVVDIVPAE